MGDHSVNYTNTSSLYTTSITTHFTFPTKRDHFQLRRHEGTHQVSGHLVPCTTLSETEPTVAWQILDQPWQMVSCEMPGPRMHTAQGGIEGGGAREGEKEVRV